VTCEELADRSARFSRTHSAARRADCSPLLGWWKTLGPLVYDHTRPIEGDPLAYILTRINLGDYDTWKPMFDQDKPRARAASTGWRIFRSVDDPGQVFIQVDFASVEDAQQGRERLLASGVLD
jgi:hypothetical protein